MGTEVIMNELPNCDICAKRGQKVRKARYDAATRWGPWAYMCNSCWFMDAASRELGTGIGQELILKADPEDEDEDDWPGEMEPNDRDHAEREYIAKHGDPWAESDE